MFPFAYSNPHSYAPQGLISGFLYEETHGNQWAWKDMQGSWMGLRIVSRMILMWGDFPGSFKQLILGTEMQGNQRTDAKTKIEVDVF